MMQTVWISIWSEPVIGAVAVDADLLKGIIPISTPIMSPLKVAVPMPSHLPHGWKIVSGEVEGWEKPI